MPAFNAILVPVDFSAGCAQTACCAAALARRVGSRVALMHVLPELDRSLAALANGGVLLDEVLEFQRMRTRSRLEAFAEGNMPGCQPELEVQEGDPAVLIADYAHSHHVDLIMMPTRGAGPFRRFILGSVTAKVLHDVHCPVWTGVHVENMPAVHPPALDAVICAVDLCHGSEGLMQWAGSLAALFGARLVVVHAIPSLGYSPETYYLEADLRHDLISQARRKIARILGEQGSAAEVVVQGGPVAAVVRAAAEDSRASLVVIGRAAHNGVVGRLRTNSYTIIRDAPCPVMSV